MQIGVFGGTFDPIHMGHLIVAEAVRVRLKLDKVIFIPAGNPWLKSERSVTDGEHRHAMVKLATDPNPYFEISRMELERPGPSYTVDTMDELKQTFREGDEPYFIVGPDALAAFGRWKDPERLIRMCSIVAVKRPDVDAIDVSSLEREMPWLSGRIKQVDVPLIGISSTGIRDLAAARLSIRYLVPREVAEYITQYQVYQI